MRIVSIYQSVKLGLCAILLAAGGCAAYQPRDLNPVLSESEFRNRTFSDPGLYAFVFDNSTTKPAQWPPPQLGLRTLTLVAFYFHPDLDVARAKAATAQAGLTTAAQRTNPSLTFTPQYDTPLDQGLTSPWTLGIGLDIPIETAGKRGYRIAQAEALSRSARLSVAQSAWQVRSRLRSALMDHLLAMRDVALLRDEQATRTQVVNLLERQLAAGQISVFELDTARIDLDGVRLAVQGAQGQVQQTRAALAMALGLPVAAIEGASFDDSEINRLPTPNAIPPMTTQRQGLLNRLDITKLLSEYAAAEAALQLEVAKQYPDIHLGPGYEWDQGVNKYAMGLSVQLPILNRNQGPIAEAEARRKEVAARFLALQAQVIGQTEQAVARYEGAMAELAEAQRLAAVQDSRLQAARRSVELGQEDALALASAQVQSAVTARSNLNALRKAQATLGELEDAVQRPLEEGQSMPGVPTTSPRDEGGRKESVP